MGMTRSAAGAPSEEGIEHAVSLAGAANSLAGYEVSDDVRDLGRRNLCVEMSDAETIAAVAKLAKLAAKKH